MDARLADTQDGPKLVAHVARVSALGAAAACLLIWMTVHASVTYGDGLRYIRQAQSYERGHWSQVLPRATDHPMHPLLIAGAHALLGGDTPESWQHAAQVVCVTTGTLLVVPVYLTTALLLGASWAWMGPLLVLACPLVNQVAPNVLSESTFLLFWFSGLAATFQYLKRGALVWLVPVVALSVLAYLTRPEGLLLPLVLVVTLLVSPLARATRLPLGRWAAGLGVLLVAPVLFMAPFIVMKGGLATKPAVGRVLGLSDQAPAGALERERDPVPDQTLGQQYQAAAVRVWLVLVKTARPVILVFGLIGFLTLVRTEPDRSRLCCLGLLIVLGISLAMIRLYVKAGYATGRHFVVAISMISLFAAQGARAMSERVDRLVKGRPRWAWLEGRSGWVASGLAVLLALGTGWRALGAAGPGFAPYHEAAGWLRANAAAPGAVLDLTNWSLYFSRMPGYQFGDLYEAANDERTRWVLVQPGHLQGKFPYTRAVRALVGNRQPVATFPADGPRVATQVAIYDRTQPELPRKAELDTGRKRR